MASSSPTRQRRTRVHKSGPNWLPEHLILDKHALGILYQLNRPPDVTLDEFEELVPALPAEDIEQLLLPWLDDSWNQPQLSQATPAVLVPRALARLLTIDELKEIWELFAKFQQNANRRWRIKEFIIWVTDAPPDEFLEFLSAVDAFADDSEITSRVRTVRQSRLAEPLLRQARDISRATTIMANIITGMPVDLDLGLSHSTNELTILLPVQELIDGFRHSHPAYKNVSNEQSFFEVHSYLEDISRYVVNLGLSANTAKSQVAHAYKEYMSIRTWLNRKDGQPDGLRTRQIISTVTDPMPSKQFKRKRTAYEDVSGSSNGSGAPAKKKTKLQAAVSKLAIAETNAPALKAKNATEKGEFMKQYQSSNTSKRNVPGHSRAETAGAKSTSPFHQNRGRSTNTLQLSQQLENEIDGVKARHIENSAANSAIDLLNPLPDQNNKETDEASSSSTESSSNDEESTDEESESVAESQSNEDELESESEDTEDETTSETGTSSEADMSSEVDTSSEETESESDEENENSEDDTPSLHPNQRSTKQRYLIL